MSTGASGPGEVEAEEGVEAGDVVDVQVREEQGVDGPDLGGREAAEAALAAVEEEPVGRLPGGDAGQQRVVAARLAEDLVLDAHERCLLSVGAGGDPRDPGTGGAFEPPL